VAGFAGSFSGSAVRSVDEVAPGALPKNPADG